MSKKVLVAVIVAAALMVAGLGAVSVSAATTASQTNTVATSCGTKAAVIRHVLGITEQSQLNAELSQAVTSGKLTQAQADKLTSLWTAYQQHPVAVKVYLRLLAVKSQTNLESILNSAVTAGKITQAQATKIETVWQNIHLT